jgi:rRNA maturation endonuclease Nob1
MKEIVPFCTRCFAISAVDVDKETNFCHYCGSQGTCVPMKRNDADYLRENIQNAIDRARMAK